MKIFLISLAIWICAFDGANAQSVTRTTLRDALHCIKNGDREWLASPLSDKQVLHAAAVTDKSSYPGEKHLIVVVYESSGKGQVFDLKEETKGEKRLFTIENNGSFEVVKREVVFKDPPLGGVWTQEHLAASIKKISDRPPKSFPVSQLMARPPDIVCNSYTSSTK